MQLNIVEERREENISILKLEGEMDIYTSPQLKEKIVALVEEKRPFIILDLKELSYMDSTGLGVMAAGLKRVRENRGDMVLVNVPKIVKKILDITDMGEILKTYPDYEEAIKNLRSRR